MKKLILLITLMGFIACNSSDKPPVKPLVMHIKTPRTFVYEGIFYKDLTRAEYFEQLGLQIHDTLIPDETDPTKNVWQTDSIWFFGKIDSTRKFKTKLGNDSFGINLYAIPRSWVRAYRDTFYQVHEIPKRKIQDTVYTK